MESTEALRQRREQLVQEMLGITSARKGTINEQFFPVVRDGKPTQELRGPYLVWTTKKQGKTVSIRLTTPEAVAAARQDIANHQRLLSLFHDFQTLTEQLGEREREGDVAVQTLKKTPKSPSRKMRK